MPPNAVLSRRLAGHHRATRRARRAFLWAILFFGLGAVWFAGRMIPGRWAVPVTVATVVGVTVAGLAAQRRRAAERLAHLGEPGPALVSYAVLGQRFARHRRFQRVAYWSLILPFALLLLVLPALIPLLPASWVAGERVFLVWLLLFFGALGIVGLLDSVRRSALGLSCPFCGATLVSLNGVRLERHGCPECGTQIADGASNVAAPAATSSGGLPLPATAGDFRERNAQLEAESGRDYLVFIGGSIVVFVAALVLLGWGAKSGRSPSATFVPPLVGIVLALAIALLGGQRWVWRARRLGLACPSCDELLAGTSATPTEQRGACPTCGTPLWQN